MTKIKIMRKLTKIRLFLATILLLLGCITSTYGHNKTERSKKQMYDVIQIQLNKGQIDLKTAQKMWAEYIRCCK